MNPNLLALDIETVPLAKSLGADWTDADVKKASLSPRLGRVLCIGYATRARAFGDEVRVGVDYATSEGDEGEVLRALTGRLHKLALAGGAVVTWNGKGFDIPFLALRCAAHGIAHSFGPLLKRWQDREHIDVKHVALCGETRRAGEGLDEWAAAFGLPPKPEGLDGSQVYAAYLSGAHDRIRQYVQHDASTTLALHDRIAPVML